MNITHYGLLLYQEADSNFSYLHHRGMNIRLAFFDKRKVGGLILRSFVCARCLKHACSELSETSVSVLLRLDNWRPVISFMLLHMLFWYTRISMLYPALQVICYLPHNSVLS